MLNARLKGKHGAYKVIFSDSSQINELESYTIPESIERSHDYDPELGLEVDEWYHVDLDVNQQEAMILGYYNSAQSSADINRITTEDYKEIEVIYLVENDVILFTKITSGNRIENKRFIKIEGSPIINRQEHSIEFTGIVDAYYNGQGRLFFRDYSRIRSLFPGIEAFYKEATESEKVTFVSFSLFNAEGLDINRISMRASKRIASILLEQSLDLDNLDTQQKIRDCANKYSESNVQLDSGQKIIINDTKSLDAVLNLITGRYFTSEITGEKMEARAVNKLT